MKKKIHATLFALAALLLIPVFYLLLLSFSAGWTYPALLPTRYSAVNWLAMMRGSSGLLQSLLLSLFISGIVASGTTAAGFMISGTISRHPQKKWLMLFCYFPFVMSPVMYALLLNHFFILAGLSGTLTGVLLAQLVITLPYCLILLQSFWDEKIAGLEQISHTLGATGSETFFKVILPVARPQLLLCFFQLFLISWFEFGLTQVIGVGKIHTLTLKVYEYVGEANPYFAAISSLLILLPPVILLRLNKQVVLPTFD